MSTKENIINHAAIFREVNNLITLGLMQPLTEIPHIYVFKEVIKLKDKKYVTSWCQNVFRVWALTYKTFSPNLELAVFDKESGELICRYSDSLGLIKD